MQDIIKLIEKDGWVLVAQVGSGTVNSFAQISSDILAEV